MGLQVKEKSSLLLVQKLLNSRINCQKKIITTLRFVVGFSLALYLIYATLKFTGVSFWRVINQASIPLLLLALFFQGVIACITSYRLSLLLRVQGVHLQIYKVLRLTLIGVFFSLTLPGSVSGDLVKMSFVTQYTKDKKMEAILTVMLDRALGLFGLFIVASFVVFFSLPFLLNLEKNYRPVQIAAFLVGLGSIGGMILIGLVELRQTLLRFPWFAWIVNHSAQKMPTSIVSNLTRLVKALELYRQNRRTILVAIALSILVHLCLAINLFCVGASIGDDTLGLRDYFLASLVANAVAAIPLTPGGIGTRDAMVAMFFSAMQAPMDKIGIVPVIMTLIFVFWGLVGGAIFVFSKELKIAL